jgi:hypothetical protein
MVDDFTCPHGVSGGARCLACYVIAHPLPHLSYQDWVKETAAVFGSDGCSFVGSAYRWCCLEHDIAYRSGLQRDGTPVTKAEADKRFRSCIQRKSPFGWWSPLAWIRWLGVKLYTKPTAPTGPHARVSLSAVELSAIEARRRIIAEVEGRQG